MSEPLRGVPEDPTGESTGTGTGTDGTSGGQQDASTDGQPDEHAQQGQQRAGQGRSTKETRFEFGFFGRKVTTQDATPPDWDGGGPKTG